MNGSNCDKSTIVGPDIACHCFSAGGVRANNGSNEGGMLLSAALFLWRRGVWSVSGTLLQWKLIEEVAKAGDQVGNRR